MKALLRVTALTLTLASTSTFASAAILQSTDQAGFAIDAAGIPLSFIDFEDGVNSGVRNGSTYSADVVFSSGASANGGVNSVDVNDSSAEMGPVGGYNGLLIMDFVADLAAISFASYQFNIGESVSFFNDGILVQTLFASGNDFPGFDGFVGTFGTVFDRVVMDGTFYSLQNLSYGFADASPVPVPAALPLLAAGLGAMGIVGWRRKKTSA